MCCRDLQGCWGSCVWDNHCGWCTEWPYETTDQKAVGILNEMKLSPRIYLFIFCFETSLLLLQPLHTWSLGHADSGSFFFLFFFPQQIVSVFSIVIPCVSNWFLWEKFWCTEIARCFVGPQRIHVWTCRSRADCRKHAERRRNVGSQKYLHAYFHVLSQYPLWDRILARALILQHRRAGPGV